jgi:type II secretion system protein N
MYIGPRIMQLVKGVYSIDLSGTAYKGDIYGSLHAKDKHGESFESKLSFKGFDLAEYEFLAGKLKQSVTGKVSGDIVYGKDSANADENGKAELRLTAGRLQLAAPIFGISSVDLQNIDLQLELRNGEITIGKAELAGSEIKASVSGSIQLQPDMKLSELNLKGTLEPLAEFYKNYPEIRELLKSMKKRVRRGQYSFAITGTLAEPKFRLL